MEKIEDLIRNGQNQGALPLLEAYLKDFPKSSRAHYDLGYLYFRSHDFGASIESLSKSLSLNVWNPEAHKILGLDCSIVGRYDLADRELREASREDPGSAEIHYFLGRLYYTRGVYPLAKKELEETLRLDPKYMKGWDNLGLTLEALGQNSAALTCYATAVQLNKDLHLRSEWPYLNLSSYYNHNQKPGLAIEYARKALDFNPHSANGYFELAKAYRTLGEWQNCLDSSRKAIQMNPNDPDFYFILGTALRKLGRTKESQAALNKSEEIHKAEQSEPRDMGDPAGPGMTRHAPRLDHDEKP